MYRYDALDAEMLADRASEFRSQVGPAPRRRDHEDQFKPLRLDDASICSSRLYAADPPSLTAAEQHQLHGLAAVARRYDKGYGHFTTRQNIQFTGSS